VVEEQLDDAGEPRPRVFVTVDADASDAGLEAVAHGVLDRLLGLVEGEMPLIDAFGRPDEPDPDRFRDQSWEGEAEWTAEESFGENGEDETGAFMRQLPRDQHSGHDPEGVG
jgi:hypothetical protein